MTYRKLQELPSQSLPKEKLLAQGGRVELLYWDPAENKSFMIPAKN